MGNNYKLTTFASKGSWEIYEFEDLMHPEGFYNLMHTCRKATSTGTNRIVHQIKCRYCKEKAPPALLLFLKILNPTYSKELIRI